MYPTMVNWTSILQIKFLKEWERFLVGKDSSESF